MGLRTHAEPAIGLGVVALIAFAWVISENRCAVSRSASPSGLRSACLLAVLFSQGAAGHGRVRLGQPRDRCDRGGIRAGTSFVFGYIGGGPLPFELKLPGNDFVLAFQALPIVLLMSVLTTLLFYWGILPPIVRGFSFALERTLGSAARSGSRPPPTSSSARSRRRCSSGPTSPNSRARIVRGDDRRHGRHRRHGAGALRAVPRVGDSRCRRPPHHRLGARRAGRGHDRPDHGAGRRNGARTGSARRRRAGRRRAPWTRSPRATDAGLALLLNMIAMLIVFVALVYLANAMLGLASGSRRRADHAAADARLIMAPVCWLIGIPWSQALTAGGLMGVKTVLNELIAYLEMAKLPPDALDPRSRADHALRHVRLRQFRQRRHHDRRH